MDDSHALLLLDAILLFPPTLILAALAYSVVVNRRGRFSLKALLMLLATAAIYFFLMAQAARK